MGSTKVCCFCERWESGGIESFLYNVLLRIDLNSIQVDVVAAELAESIFTEQLQRRGVHFIQLSGKQQKLSENYRLFRELLHAERYDVLHLNIFHGLSLYYARLARQAGIPVRIAHSHNTALRKSRTKPLKQFVHRVAKNIFTGSATDLWACSAPAADFLFSKSALETRGCRFIRNGISVNRFCFDIAERERVRRELGLQDKLVIGNVGRLCYQKNQEFLLDVFAEVIRRKPESSLLLVGEGDAQAMLRQKAASLGITGKVIFYGTAVHVEQLLWAMDVFAFPSRFEGLGIAVIEAQAAGLPVLCSEHIPGEARATAQFQMLRLNAGAEQWAGKLLELGGTHRNRMEGHMAVRNAGFDIVDVSREIEAGYTRAHSNGNT